MVPPRTIFGKMGVEKSTGFGTNTPNNFTKPDPPAPPLLKINTILPKASHKPQNPFPYLKNPTPKLPYLPALSNIFFYSPQSINKRLWPNFATLLWEIPCLLLKKNHFSSNKNFNFTPPPLQLYPPP